MLVKGQLNEAQAENLSASPSNLPAGRFWLDTVLNKLRAYIGGAVRSIVTEDQTQTLTNKTLTSPTITSPAITGATLDGDDNTFQDVPLTAIKTVLADASKVITRDASGVIQSQATLTLGQGGTGQTTKTAAFDALSPLTTKGDIPVHDGTNNARKAVGSNGQVLTADSAAAGGIKWASAPAPVQAIATKTADYTFTTSDDVILINAASASVTITLPAATAIAKPIFIGRSDEAFQYEAKIIPSGSDTINESTEIYLLEKNEFVQLISDQSSTYKIISKGKVSL
jgi:hypothetical protein